MYQTYDIKLVARGAVNELIHDPERCPAALVRKFRPPSVINNGRVRLGETLRKRHPRTVASGGAASPPPPPPPPPPPQSSAVGQLQFSVFGGSRLVDRQQLKNLTKPRGELIVVGSGIQVSQLTREAEDAIKSANKVLYCVAHPHSEAELYRMNSTAESLSALYSPEKMRMQSYHEMVERIMKEVRAGKKVCAVFYGHPGVFAFPSHESIRVARLEGYKAKMLPGVSSLDCLFADLGLDPSKTGCQLVEATDLLVRDIQLDTYMTVVLWQVGSVGELSWNPEGTDNRGLPLLKNKLIQQYDDKHPAVIYEAAQELGQQPRIDEIRIGELTRDIVSGLSTLVIESKDSRPLDLDMLDEIDLEID